MHKVDPGECDSNYKPDKSVWMECGTASITYFHTKVFAVHATIHFDRNKDFHQETLDEAEERAETSALWGPHSEFHPLREIGAKPSDSKATEEGGHAEANPFGHSLEIDVYFHLVPFKNYFHPEAAFV